MAKTVPIFALIWIIKSNALANAENVTISNDNVLNDTIFNDTVFGSTILNDVVWNDTTWIDIREDNSETSEWPAENYSFIVLPDDDYQLNFTSNSTNSSVGESRDIKDILWQLYQIQMDNSTQQTTNVTRLANQTYRDPLEQLHIEPANATDNTTTYWPMKRCQNELNASHCQHMIPYLKLWTISMLPGDVARKTAFCCDRWTLYQCLKVVGRVRLATSDCRTTLDDVDVCGRNMKDSDECFPIQECRRSFDACAEELAQEIQSNTTRSHQQRCCDYDGCLKDASIEFGCPELYRVELATKCHSRYDYTRCPHVDMMFLVCYIFVTSTVVGGLAVVCYFYFHYLKGDGDLDEQF